MRSKLVSMATLFLLAFQIDEICADTSTHLFAGWGKRPALLLIDVCQAYWTPGSPLDTSSNPASAASPEVMKRLLTTARSAKLPVIWTTVSYKKDMSDAGLFYLKAKQLEVWKEGNDSGLEKWLEGLEPGDGEEVVVKRHASAFFGTELVSKLTLLGVDTLVICGVSTSGCIRATALDALSYNYRPMVSSPISQTLATLKQV